MLNFRLITSPKCGLMYKVQNKHVVSNNVQKHKFFYKDRMNTLQTHTCAKIKKNLTKAFGADKLVQ